MKNLTLSFLLVLATTLFASANETDPRTAKAFAGHFAGAADIKWTRLDEGIQRASFMLGGTRAEAYYSTEGELLGTARHLFYSQLPLVVIQAISNKFADPVVIVIKEITNSEGTSYRVVMEHKEKKYNLKLTSFGEITEVTKLKK